jgi:hypothetical protein
MAIRFEWLVKKVIDGVDALRGKFRKPQSDRERVLGCGRVPVNDRRRQLGRDRDVEVIELLPAA